MFDQLSTQKRLFIAVLISILFFVAYDFLVMPKRSVDANMTSSSTNATQNIQNQAPAVESTEMTATEPNTNSSTLVHIKSKFFDATIDELGRINKFSLLEDKFKNSTGEQLSLIDGKNLPFPLEIRFTDPDLNNEAFKTPYTANLSNLDVSDNGATLILTQKLSSLTVTKTIKFSENGFYDLNVSLSKNTDYFITPGFRPNVVVDGYTVHGLILRKNDGSIEIIQDGDAKGAERFINIDIAASSDRYYTTLFYDPKKDFDVFVQKANGNNALLFVRGKQNLNISGFIGPKDHNLLRSINPELLDVIEYGWFTFIAKPMFLLLNFIHGYIGNWGWAIVVMTLIIRVILFPLTYRGMVSMNKLKEIAPKMKELQAKYKGDPQKLNAHVMELYKKNGANPMGGCLPIIIQIPIFFAIYRVLLNAIELKGAEWILWIKDLAVMDPFFILPILMGITMFLQQKITPTNFTDPMQEKIMKFLPLIFTFFFVTFPAGLTLYWFINNLCSIAQQVVVNRMFEKHKLQAKLEKNHEG